MAERAPATLRVMPAATELPGAFDAYLKADAAKVQARLPGPLAEESSRKFELAVRNLTDSCDEFLKSSQASVSHLVLGKVQSGKTAHLLGALAWAADSSISAAVVFTGVTDSLNNQTQIRLEKDLSALPGSPVEVLHVPTTKQGRLFQDFLDKLCSLVRARGEATASARPLPVLVAMKNRARAEAVRAAFSAIAEVVGSSGAILAIDDEADQASQNAQSRQRRVAATYRALAQIRQLPLRNVWLSYTATPQAVLLTDRFGALRPDFVSVVPPREGYFGLTSAMSEEFENSLIVVDDWRVPAHQQGSCPLSLTEAIYRFYLTAWVRTRFPDAFYHNALVPLDPSHRLASTQMLIHESGMKIDHSRMYRLVEDERERLAGVLGASIGKTKASSDGAILRDVFERVMDGLKLSGAPISNLAEEFFSAEGQMLLLELVRESKVAVINSDAGGPTSVEDRPVEDSDYEMRRTWIMIGGDILGRGITIPQLTVSYFLRSSQSPNFDTVLQQLRFCGYRAEYQKWISIHAPQQSFQDLKYMEIVDRAVWQRAHSWDREHRRLSGKAMPRVFYAASLNARFEPTRANVRDPNIADRKINADYLFALRDIFDPRDLRLNIGLLGRWRQESRIEPNEADERWLRFDDLSPVDAVRLLGSWSGSDGERQHLGSIAELFDPGLGELGLCNIPTVAFVSATLSDAGNRPDRLLSRLNDVRVTRRAQPGPDGSTFAGWQAAFDKNEFLTPSTRAGLAVPHVGQGQRTLRGRVNHSAVIFIVEPILGLLESKDLNSVVALGIGFAALSPDGFQVRTIGHA